MASIEFKFSTKILKQNLMKMSPILKILSKEDLKIVIAITHCINNLNGVIILLMDQMHNQVKQ